jgi:hypothetical protein
VDTAGVMSATEVGSDHREADATIHDWLLDELLDDHHHSAQR